MKKLRLILFTVIVSSIITLIFSACTPTENTDKVDEITLYFKDLSGEVTSLTIDITGFEDGFLYDVLISEKYHDEINVEIGEGQYGMFINSIKNLIPNPESEQYEYIGLYSTLIEFFDDEWSEPVTVSDIIFYGSAVGISELPIVKDASYLFVLEVYYS